MKVLLTGASGFLGRPLAKRLLAAGHSLHTISRTPQVTQSGETQAYRWSEGEAFPDAALAGVDAVIHLAGENIGAWPWTAARKRRILDSRVQGTGALVAAMAKQNPRPGIFLAASAVGYYGDSGAAACPETRAPGSGFLAEVVQAWEKEIFRAEALGIRTVAVRNGLVLGQGGALAKMAPAFRAGLGSVLGTGRQYWSWIHLEDAVGIFLHALSHPAVSGPVNGCAPEPVTQEAFSLALAKALGRPRLLTVPAWILRLGLGGMADTLLQGQRAEAAKILGLGYPFRYPSLPVALADLTA